MSRWQTRLYAFHFLYLQPAWRTAEPLLTATLDTSTRAACCAARFAAHNIPRALESVNNAIWPTEAAEDDNGAQEQDDEHNCDEETDEQCVKKIENEQTQCTKKPA